MKKKLFTGLVGLLFSLILLSCNTKYDTSNNTAVARNGALQVKGVNLCNEKGENLMLRGVSLGWHNFWPRFYNEDAVTWLADDWKVNVVRAAMGVGPDNSYLQNPDFAIECVTKVVDAAIKNGIYVIIDFHSHKIHTQEAQIFFKQMAEKYGEYPNVIYEIFNEPDYFTWPEVKAYSEEIIKTIRSIDPDNIILVGSPHWDQDLHLVAESPLEGQTNIMYTMHFYAATHKAELRQRTDSALAKGIPVFISECASMEATGDGPIDYDQWNEYLNWMEKNNLSWVVWSLADKDETCSMLLPQAESTGNWTEDLLKEWGKISRNAIRSLNGE